MLASYEEPLGERERRYIETLLEADAIGYFKTLRLIGIIGAGLVIVIGILTSIATPQDELEQKFSLPRFLFASFCFLVLVYSLAIYGKKRFSGKFRKDLREGVKLIIGIPIQQKQFVPQNHTFHFHLNFPGLLSIEVSADDFKHFQAGDIVNVEFAKHSMTYLGYF